MTPRRRNASWMRSAYALNVGYSPRCAGRGRGRSIAISSTIFARGGRHHQHTVREPDRFFDAVRDEEHRLARLEPQQLEVVADLRARDRVERAEGLVHQQHRRLMDQRARNRDALPHAPGELMRIPVGGLRDADLFHQR